MDGQLFYKVGMENGTSYWSTGTFDEKTNKFVPAPGVGALGDPNQRADYGEFYSSKSFAVANPCGIQSERVLIGWVGEEGGPMREWAGIQSIPRLITADPENKGRVLFNPVSTIEALRVNKTALAATTLTPGSATQLKVRGVHLDLEANFSGPFVAGMRFGIAVAVPDSDHAGSDHADGPVRGPSTHSLSSTRSLSSIRISSSTRSLTGQSGTKVTVVVDDPQSGWATLTVGPHRGQFPLPKSGPLRLRVLVDASCIEAFVADGRAVITHRVYPGPSERSVLIFNDGLGTVGLSSAEAFNIKAPVIPSVSELLRHSAGY
jgi:beta-fructofuranosidase